MSSEHFALLAFTTKQPPTSSMDHGDGKRRPLMRQEDKEDKIELVEGLSKGECSSRRIQGWHHAVANCTTVWDFPVEC